MWLALPLLVSVLSVTRDPCHGDVGVGAVTSIFSPLADIKHFRLFFFLYLDICIPLLPLLLDRSSCSLLVG